MKIAPGFACVWLAGVLALASPVLAVTRSGRWDLNVTGAGLAYPGWLGISDEGGTVAVTYVGRVGSARVIREFTLEGNRLSFSRDEWFGSYQKVDHVFHLDDDRVTGTFIRADGTTFGVTGVAAPALDRLTPTEWTPPRPLFDGGSFNGWIELNGGKTTTASWRIEDGVLVTSKGTSDLGTVETFDDFQLHVEFNCPPNGNSGIYLRGRYEVQIEDDAPTAPLSQQTGGVYGWEGPAEPVPRRPGEWQTLEITFVGRRATVRLNGQTLFAEQEIPGITGAALDSDEAKPGPIVLQSSHGRSGGEIRFRNLTIATPAR